LPRELTHPIIGPVPRMLDLLTLPTTQPLLSAVIAVNKRDLDKHYAYTTAISTLNLALLASVGPDNKTLFKALFLPAPLYSVTPMQIVEAMLQEYGKTTGTDLQRLAPCTPAARASDFTS
jgi:hypothetical protein